MDQFIQFVINHWILFSALFVVIILLVLSELQGKLQGIPSISIQQATNLINHQQAVLLDIRDSSSYQKGYIVNSINVPGAELKEKIASLERFKTNPVILVDASGQQVLQPALTIKKSGFNQVYILQGGINAWRTGGLPLVK